MVEFSQGKKKVQRLNYIKGLKKGEDGSEGSERVGVLERVGLSLFPTKVKCSVFRSTVHLTHSVDQDSGLQGCPKGKQRLPK